MFLFSSLFGTHADGTHAEPEQRAGSGDVDSPPAARAHVCEHIYDHACDHVCEHAYETQNDGSPQDFSKF